jgi:Nitrile hydratase beta subunit, N-terminal
VWWFDAATDGVHDLGGMEDFGHVAQEQDEPVFQEPWERRVFGIGAVLALQRLPSGKRATWRRSPVGVAAACKAT